MTRSKWKKAYKGPFTKRKAFELMRDLKTSKDSQIEKVAIRKRNDKEEFDIYIKTI
jgi:hypothetical protein